MTTIVAGYFDSEDTATRAMDELLNTPEFQNSESEVISTIASGTGNAGDVGGFVPFAPNTPGGQGNAVIGGVPVTGGGGRRLLNELGDDEAGYFQAALKNGGVLALVKVEDHLAMRVGRIFNQFGARTYQE